MRERESERERDRSQQSKGVRFESPCSAFSPEFRYFCCKFRPSRSVTMLSGMQGGRSVVGCGIRGLDLSNRALSIHGC